MSLKSAAKAKTTETKSHWESECYIQNISALKSSLQYESKHWNLSLLTRFKPSFIQTHEIIELLQSQMVRNVLKWLHVDPTLFFWLKQATSCVSINAFDKHKSFGNGINSNTPPLILIKVWGVFAQFDIQLVWIPGDVIGFCGISADSQCVTDHCNFYAARASH